MKPVLYDYWRSSAAYRLRIAFGLLGIDYEARHVDLLSGEHRGEANLARNPQGLVPDSDLLCPGWRVMAHAFEMARDDARMA